MYLNAPFINTVLGCHLDAVIHLKDETRQIYQDAGKLFEQGEGKRPGFRIVNKRIECWDITGFEMEGLEKSVRVVRYCEQMRDRKGRESMQSTVTAMRERRSFIPLC